MLSNEEYRKLIYDLKIKFFELNKIKLELEHKVLSLEDQLKKSKEKNTLLSDKISKITDRDKVYIKTEIDSQINAIREEIEECIELINN